MRSLFALFIIIVLAGCGASGTAPEGKAPAEEGTRMLMAAAAPVGGAGPCTMNCYETTDVDNIPDFVIDRPFVYMVQHLVSATDHRALLSTVIPHDEKMTYRLQSEAVVKDSIWEVTFQALDSVDVQKGLFVHTNLRIPHVLNGNAIKEVHVFVLDQNGNVTGEIGGVPGQPRTQKPVRRRVHDSRDEDPSAPTLENVVIYANGGMVSGDQFVVGYAQVNGSGSPLALANSLPDQVDFSLGSGTGSEFLFFDHDVSAMNGVPVVCTFSNGDGDPATPPRPNVVRP